MMGAPGTTPGWRFEMHSPDSQYLGNIVGSYGPNANGIEMVRTINVHTRYGDDAEQLANAHQAVASGEMYDALILAKEAIRQLLRNHTHSLDDAHYEAEDAINAALAKARGES